MTKTELTQLQRDIHTRIMELNKLQDLHTHETGRVYIIAGPLPVLEENERHLHGSGYRNLEDILIGLRNLT